MGKDRHLNYFKLLDAFKEDRCPICTLAKQASLSYLASLFHEYVNDPGVRSSLRRSGGFCNWHAWLATEIPLSSTGISIIYKDILDQLINRLQQEISQAEGRPSESDGMPLSVLPWWYGADGTRAPCPLCINVAQGTRSYLKELLDHLHEGDFQEAFRSSRGLCLPHLSMAARDLDDHHNLKVLMEIQIQKAQKLSFELGEFWRKHDYRFRDEPMGCESDSWRRAIEWFVGAREVFPAGLLVSGKRSPLANVIGRLSRFLGRRGSRLLGRLKARRAQGQAMMGERSR